MSRRRSRGADPQQLRLGLEPAPRSAEELLARLQNLGLRGIDRCRLTHNRTVMVSFGGSQLRVHRGFLDAPPDVLQAIARFVSGRTRAERLEAQRKIITHPLRVLPAAHRGRRERPREEDAPLVAELRRGHRELNRHFFDSTLSNIDIRISYRMRTRLGQYTAASAQGDPPEIALSRLHVDRHSWDEVMHTLLHEMVHQWQAEQGKPIDHGVEFRKMAREVGIEPAARRRVRSSSRHGRVVTHGGDKRKAARRD